MDSTIIQFVLPPDSVVVDTGDVSKRGRDVGEESKGRLGGEGRGGGRGDIASI